MGNGEGTMEDLVRPGAARSAGEFRVKSSPKCRHCGSEMPLTFVDLGLSAVANSYVPMDKVDEPEPKYTLHTRVCEN